MYLCTDSIVIQKRNITVWIHWDVYSWVFICLFIFFSVKCIFTFSLHLFIFFSVICIFIFHSLSSCFLIPPSVYVFNFFIFHSLSSCFLITLLVNVFSSVLIHHFQFVDSKNIYESTSSLFHMPLHFPDLHVLIKNYADFSQTSISTTSMSTDASPN